MANLSKVDKFILTFLICLTASLSYFLYNDSLILSGIDQTTAQTIGSFQKSVKDVRRKNAENFAWIPTQSSENIFENDSVFTGDGSFAQIKLNDGGEIDISENSLVNLSSKNGQMQLDLRFGEFTGKIAEGKSLSIKSGKEEFTLQSEKNGKGEGSKVSLAKSRTGEFKIKVLEGAAKLKTSKEEKTIDQNSLALQLKENSLQATSVPPKIDLEQVNLKIEKKLEEWPVTLSWQHVGEISSFKILISEQENFETTITSELTNKSNLTIKNSWISKKYFWKVQGFAKSGTSIIESTIGQIEINALEAPIIIQPQQTTQLEFKLKNLKDTLSVKLPLEWKHSINFSHYQIQTSKDEMFKTIFETEKVTGFKKILSLKNESTWIRVRGFQETEQISSWSQPVYVHINTFEIKPAPRPELTQNKIDFKILKNDDSILPEISWKKQTDIKKSILEIANDSSFKNATKIESTGFSEKWKEFLVGTYYFRVKLISNENQISPFSEVGILTISSADAPILKKIPSSNERGLASTSKNAQFEWSSLKRVQKYEMQYSNAEKSEKLIFSKNSAIIPVELTGKVQFKVRALANDGSPASPYSNIEEHYFASAVSIAAPTLKEPFNKSTIFLQTETSISVWLDWVPSKAATNGYQLQVSDNLNFSTLLIDQKISKNRFLLKNELKLGQYFWRVKSLGTVELENSTWSTPYTFTLYHNKNNQFQGGE